MTYNYHTLPNGIRLLHQYADYPAAHCGVFIDTGSRDEREDENGLAHFIEHTIFKGTKKRKAWHILNRLESVGGELNAYTSKEETVIYSSFLKQHYERALELIADLIHNSVFPDKELKKEKEVIADEINSYKDTPGEEILDVFDELLFQGHPIGRNILGTQESLKKFNRSMIMDFIARNYKPEKIVICSVGKIDFGKLIKLAMKHFMIPGKENLDSMNNRGLPAHQRIPVTETSVFSKTVIKPVFQAHCVIGTAAYPRNHPNRYPMILLNNILGGPAMNSRLNITVRERYGYSYHIDSNYQPYSDTGIFNIYMGCDESSLDKAINLVHRELKLLREVKLGSLQVHLARQQIQGQITLGNESNINRMLAIGKSHLHNHEVKTLEELITIFDRITSSDLIECAREVFHKDQLSTLIFKSR